MSYAHRGAPVTADPDDRRDDGERGERDLIAGDFEAITGGTGSDRLSAGSAGTRLSGGLDELDGDEGTDRLRASDGSADVLSCSGGGDRAFVDEHDMLFGCRRIARSGPAAAVPMAARDPDLERLSVRKTVEQGFDQLPEVRADVGCPPDVGHACAGTLRLVYAGHVVGSLRFTGLHPPTPRAEHVMNVFPQAAVRTAGGDWRASVSCPSC